MEAEKIHPLIDKERQKIAGHYRNDNLKVSVLSLLVSAIFLMALLRFNISKQFVELVSLNMSSRVLLVMVYYSALFCAYSLLTFPFSYIEGYLIEHKYGFSTQRLRDWFKDWIKSFFVGYIIGLIILEVIYLVIPVAPSLWWLWLSLIMVSFSVVLANVFPVLVLPLFYKTTPFEHDELKQRITDLCRRARLNIKGIYSIDLSSKTTKANAAVTGLGNTKRILLGDTMIAKYQPDETLSAVAHEITHYREHHIWWLILWQALITLGVFYVFYVIQPSTYKLFGFEMASEIAAFPLFALLFAGLSYFIRPLSSALSRYYERRADKGALQLTDNPEAFVRLIAKLCNEQLTIAYPNTIIEWYKYTHPSPGKRIAFAQAWKRD